MKQVAEKLRIDERVVVMERTNLRHLRGEHLPERPGLATLDLSFISLLKVPHGQPSKCGKLILSTDCGDQEDAGRSKRLIVCSGRKVEHHLVLYMGCRCYI